MSNEYEWGPWIEHDGKGCPCVGEYVHVEYNPLDEWFGVAGSHFEGNEHLIGSSWHWCIVPSGWEPITRYRIRKPRSKAMETLRELVNNPTTPITAPNGPTRKLTQA